MRWKSEKMDKLLEACFKIKGKGEKIERVLKHSTKIGKSMLHNVHAKKRWF